MNYLADTVALIRHMEQHPALGQRARRIFQEADAGYHRIYISSISLMEILYLSEARKIVLKIQDVITAAAASSNYLIYPVDAQVIVSAAEIDDIRELHDRIIAGTARHLAVPISTSDQILSRSKHISTIWI
jgi:PIN domain nuclease of toxin-antitoxin system